MASRTAVRTTGFAVATTAVALALVATRADDLKKLLIGQVGVPHGRLGVLTARMMPMAHQFFYGPAADRLQLRQDDVFLEVACGSGVLLEEHAADVARVAGLDLSDIQVQLAQQRLRERIERCTVSSDRVDACSSRTG